MESKKPFLIAKNCKSDKYLCKPVQRGKAANYRTHHKIGDSPNNNDVVLIKHVDSQLKLKIL